MSHIEYPSADHIDKLPIDNSSPTPQEIQIIDTLFKKEGKTISKILEELKDIIYLAILFIVFSLPQFDNIIMNLIKTTQNSIYILIFIKAIIFIFTWYFIKNLKFVRTK